ncbi:ComEA family DNA-binding protein [Geomesophilobacter sediminis]|uniref:Helix-hairpin-helix domain-containing protein n=1 Tax=Geomesophilobacter sediminis TaxID=2798584 RepID=A0A8J7IQT0_9BACT|nr:helix-hairpin-helix domain-containing protein [Geomesophilobacter sediminis]MBJ6726318.1 helix-hairpin-helix domain-containing protein [Geomesophilobacter sediminis]
MTGRRSRLALWVVALLLFLSLFIHGRVPTETVGDAPFFHAGDAKITVRLAGAFPRPGVYRYSVGATPESVIKMAVPSSPRSLRIAGGASRPLRSGDVLTLTKLSAQGADLSLSTMPAAERMQLHIPLDIDRMEASDWVALPGIGPVLAARIAADRQSNGAFGSVEELVRVRGIGPATVSRLKKYF